MTRTGSRHTRAPDTTARRPVRSLTMLLVCVFLAPAPARGAVPGTAVESARCLPEHALHWRGGTLRLENDLFTGTDRNYTNGVALSLVSRDLQGALRPECLPQPIAWYTRFIHPISSSSPSFFIIPVLFPSFPSFFRHSRPFPSFPRKREPRNCRGLGPRFRGGDGVVLSRG